MPFAFLASCNNDDDLPQVDLTLTLGQVTEVNDNFYTVLGNEISLEGLSVKALNGKNATVQNVMFYFNGFPLVGSFGNPFTGKIPTEGLKAGTYNLEFTGLLLEEDKSISNIACSFPIIIVEEEEDLPENAPEIGIYSQTLRIQK